MKEAIFMILLVIKDKKVELLVQQKMSSPLVVKRLYYPLHRTGQRRDEPPLPPFLLPLSLPLEPSQTFHNFSAFSEYVL